MIKDLRQLIQVSGVIVCMILWIEKNSQIGAKYGLDKAIKVKVYWMKIMQQERYYEGMMRMK